MRFFKSPLGLYLSDCKNMMIMSHYGFSVVINVRLYDSQDELKTGARKKTCPQFYIINPYTSSDCELHCTRDRNIGYHEKYMNGGNTGVFKKNSVCSSTHPHENSGATSVYIEKTLPEFRRRWNLIATAINRLSENMSNQRSKTTDFSLGL